MARIETELKLDFKDVLIRPKRSTIGSRSDVSWPRNTWPRKRNFGVWDVMGQYVGLPQGMRLGNPNQGLDENINDICQQYISWYYHYIFVWKYMTCINININFFTIFKFIYLHKIFLRYGELINISLPWVWSSASNVALIDKRGRYRSPKMSKFAGNCGFGHR